MFPGPLRQRSVLGLGPSFFHLFVSCVFELSLTFHFPFDYFFDEFICFGYPFSSYEGPGEASLGKSRQVGGDGKSWNTGYGELG